MPHVRSGTKFSAFVLTNCDHLGDVVAPGEATIDEEGRQTETARLS